MGVNRLFELMENLPHGTLITCGQQCIESALVSILGHTNVEAAGQYGLIQMETQ